MSAFVPTTKADLGAKRRLDSLIASLSDGIDAARDIWANWSTGDEFSRFADGLSYGDFIKARLGFALPLTDALAIMPGASTREVAKVAGVSHTTVRRANSGGTIVPPEAPAKVVGADGKSYPAKKVEVMVPTTTTVAPLPKPSVQTRRLSALAGKPVAKLGKVEARDQVNLMRRSMTILRPDSTVPTAQQRVIDLLPEVETWLALWKGVTPKP